MSVASYKCLGMGYFMSKQTKNILFIMCDQLRFDYLSCSGHPTIKTPNIDKMVNEGMLFTNFYSAQAVCSASRAGLLTGTYPNRIGISGALMPYSKRGLHDDEITIAEMLKDKGFLVKRVGG